MLVFARAITYSALFIGLVLIYIPGRLLSRVGVIRPESIQWQQICGMIIGALGAAIASWCILTFVIVGKGTPAPFDPPRRLVSAGPYRFVRNPMYIGAALALVGAALFYHSSSLLYYTGVFLFAAHLFVMCYEEPALSRMFGQDYETYCDRVGRWWPKKQR